MITRVVVDLVFMVISLIWIMYNYLFLQTITPGEFIIALMVNYCGVRYLLFTTLQYAVLAAQYGEDEDE